MNFNLLNPQQLRAARHREGPMLVLAGAGTGKTTVITYRIGHLISCGVDPGAILAVTFTNKAAREMKTRITAVVKGLGEDAMFVGTFHGFGCRMLRANMSVLGYSSRFGIADEGDQADVIKQVMGDLGLDPTGEFGVQYYLRGIRHANNTLQSEEDIREAGRYRGNDGLPEILAGYREKLRLLNLVDYDDLLLIPVSIWTNYPEIMQRYRDTYQYILVDEYQDTNLVQARMISMLAGDRKNVCVVGDDDQAIYGWRGADVKNILNFESTYDGAAIVKLEQNYRSTNAILAAANHVIAHNGHRHSKALWSENGTGEPLSIMRVDREVEEARLVLNLIQHFRAVDHINYDDVVVLYRSNFQSRIFEQVFSERRLPHRIVGSKAFYERREIKDAVAYLRIVVNPHDDLAFLRIVNVPARGVGRSSVDTLLMFKSETGRPLVSMAADEHVVNALSAKAAAGLRDLSRVYSDVRRQFGTPGNLAETIRDYFDRVGYYTGLRRLYRDPQELQSRFDNLGEFVNSAALFEERVGGRATLFDFLESYSLTDDSERVTRQGSEDDSGVALMTIHNSKGMEFDIVFVVGMETDLFPHKRSIAECSLDEERRLFYVALTRAKRRVIMTYSRTRAVRGSRQHRVPSCFMDELPEEWKAFQSAADIMTPAGQDDVRAACALMRERLAADNAAP